MFMGGKYFSSTLLFSLSYLIKFNYLFLNKKKTNLII